jgi:hypothetical protein
MRTAIQRALDEENVDEANEAKLNMLSMIAKQVMSPERQ